MASVFLKARQHAGLREENEVVGERDRVARVLQLPEHFRVGENLA